MGFFGLPKDERSKDSVHRRTPETETPVDLMPTSEGVAMCAVPLIPRSLASPAAASTRASGVGASGMEAGQDGCGVGVGVGWVRGRCGCGCGAGAVRVRCSRGAGAAVPVWRHVMCGYSGGTRSAAISTSRASLSPRSQSVSSRCSPSCRAAAPSQRARSRWRFALRSLAEV